METCYRHPGRETGVSCSSCGRPICPECMTPTPVGMRCPECSRQRTRVKTAAVMTRGDTPVVTYILMGICIALQLGQIASGSGGAGAGIGGGSLINDGALFGPAVADGEVYRIVTAGFLHAGLFHLLVNMYSLWILGTLLEPAIGRMRFLLIYFVSLLAGSFGALVVSPNVVTVGASGAIFGLMGAGVIVLRRRGIDPMQSGLPLWIGINLVFSFAVPGISVGGHIGGLIGGALAAIALFEVPHRVRALPSAVGPVLAGVIGAASVVGSLVVV
jgi:membrane associated rhomboid family serine protease